MYCIYVINIFWIHLVLRSYDWREVISETWNDSNSDSDV